MRRSRLDIIEDVLNAASGGAIKTYIMHHANLDSGQFSSYSDFLIERHLLEKRYGDSITYKTTPKGQRFLKDKNNITELLIPEK